eukprot:4107137-Pleurochrysis_carterae.AAC.2
MSVVRNIEQKRVLSQTRLRRSVSLNPAPIRGARGRSRGSGQGSSERKGAPYVERVGRKPLYTADAGGQRQRLRQSLVSRTPAH